jgi:hypothetical protein
MERGYYSGFRGSHNRSHDIFSGEEFENNKQLESLVFIVFVWGNRVNNVCME